MKSDHQVGIGDCQEKTKLTADKFYSVFLGDMFTARHRGSLLKAVCLGWSLNYVTCQFIAFVTISEKN